MYKTGVLRSTGGPKPGNRFAILTGGFYSKHMAQYGEC